MLDGFAVNDPRSTPVPDKGTASVPFEAFDTIETLPLALPADDGAKVTLKLELWPAAKVKGRLIPLRLKPVPLAMACEIVTLAPPELVTLTDCFWLLPTCTLPKFKLEGLAES